MQKGLGGEGLYSGELNLASFHARKSLIVR